MTVPDPAYVALALVPGIGHVRMAALLRTFGSAERALAARTADLARVPGMSRAAATAVTAARRTDADRIIARTSDLGGTLLVPSDPHFPGACRSIPDPPTLLFAAGRLDLTGSAAVAIVGSRTHTRYGADVTRHLAAGAARAGLAVVSGMARGIDALAHHAALDAGGSSIGILGNGLGVVYPSANRRLYERMASTGLLLTEFPPGERPHAGSFPRRNRLISALARVLVVVEAREKSGALITVDCTLAQGKDVLAVPGPITSPVSVGCNRLIQAGAKPVLGLQDLLEEYGLRPASQRRTPSTLSAAERRLLEVLSAGDDHVDALAAGSGLPPADALATLTDLELRGLVEALPGKRYRSAWPAGEAAV